MRETKGKAIVLGDDIDTDVIIGSGYLSNGDPKFWAQHALELVRPDFASVVREGDVIVAGTTFGSGSARENAAIALREAGIRGVIARSFSRTFYRNAFNNGLPLLEVEDGLDGISDMDAIHVDFPTGRIVDITCELHLQAKPIPAFLLDMVDAGGLIPWLRRNGDWVIT